MFNLGNNLKRSWQILWNYKVLWFFAFLLALFSGGGGGGGNSGIQYSGGREASSSHYTPGQWGVWGRQIEAWFLQNISPLFETEQRALETAIWIIVGVMALAIVFGLIAALVRYPTESAIIRMVNERENTGAKLRFKEGWKLGWTHRALNMFLIDLMLAIPVLIYIAIIAVVAVTSFFGLYYNRDITLTAGTGVLIAALILLTIVFVLGMVFLGILRQFFVRAAVIEGKNFGESFSRGWQLFKKNSGNALLMWITLIGVMIVVGIALVIVAIILVPAYAILAIPGAIAAAIPGAIAYGISSLFAGQVVTWIIAALIAIPFFFIVTFSPLILLGGLVQLFSSNNWTLTYRQFAGMEQPPVLPQPEPVTPPAVPAEPVG